MSSLRVVLSSLIGAWGAAAALLLLAFASLASLADAQTAPTVVFADAQPVIIQRSYPSQQPHPPTRRSSHYTALRSPLHLLPLLCVVSSLRL